MIRLKISVVALGAAVLLLMGFSPNKLPFVPGALFSDSVTSHWINVVFLRESVLEQGEFPLWRETLMAGQPFAANPLNKTAYPLQWLALIFPSLLHLNLMIALHFGIAGWGMWRWVSTFKLRQEATALSTLAYLLAPRLIGHTGAGHLDLLYALAWFPWLMFAVWQLVHAEKSARHSILQLGFFAALMLLADVRLSLFGLSTAFAYGIYLLLQDSKSQRLGFSPLLKKAAFSLLIFLLLTIAVIAPLLAWRPYLNRADLTVKDAGVFSLEPLHLVGLLLPAHEGNIETLTYLGFPVLILAIIGGFSAPRQRAFWLMLILLAMFYALGSNGFLWSLLVKILPILLWFRVPARAWFVVVLIAPLLAGYGLNSLMELTENRQKILPQSLKRRRLAAFSLLVSMLICGSFTLISLPLPDSVGISVMVTGGVVGGLLLAALNGWLETRYLALAFILVTVVDLAWTDKRWAEWRGESDWLDPYRPLAERLEAENAARIYSPAYNLPQQVAAEYDLRLFGGVDPFQLTGIVNAIQQGSGIISDDYSVIQPPLLDIESEDFSQANRAAIPDTQILAAWDVSHIVAAYPIEHDRLTLIATIDDIYVYQNLDYVPLVEHDDSPNWAKNWTDLPDQATIDRLNQITWITALISGISFLMCLSLLLLWQRDSTV